MQFKIKSTGVASGDNKPAQNLAGLFVSSRAEYKERYANRPISAFIATKALSLFANQYRHNELTREQIAKDGEYALGLQCVVNPGLTVVPCKAILPPVGIAQEMAIEVSPQFVDIMNDPYHADWSEMNWYFHSAFAEILDRLLNGPVSHRFNYQLIMWCMGFDPLKEYKANKAKQADTKEIIATLKG